MKPDSVIENDKIEFLEKRARQCGCEYEQVDNVVVFYMMSEVPRETNSFFRIADAMSIDEILGIYDMSKLADAASNIARRLWRGAEKFLKNDPDMLAALRAKYEYTSYAVNT